MPIRLVPISAGDLPTLHSIHRRIEVGDNLPLVTTLREMEEWLNEPNLDLSVDGRLVMVDEEPVGYGLVFHSPSGERLERVFLHGGIDPAFRQRGAGRELFGWQVQRGREKLAGCDPALPWFLRTFGFDWIEDSFRLYRRFGFEPVRYYEEMVRPLSDLPEPAASEEFTVEPWDPARNEEIRLLRNRAFADHWGSTPMDARVWQHLMDSKGMRHDLSLLATVGDQVVGFCLNAAFPEDETITGRKEAWIELLATGADHRKRGVATALLIASFHSFAAQGFTHACIGVDSENLTGAHQLYRRLGFEPEHRSVSYQLEVSSTYEIGSPASETTNHTS